MKALAGRLPSSGSVASPLKAITSPATNRVPSAGDRIVGVGTLPTLMVIGVETVVLTPSDTVSRTVYWPG